MKRRKHRKAVRHSARAIERKATQAILAYDIARYSAETILYRMAMTQRAATGPFSPEAFTMVSEKMLAAGEAMVIALRQLGPIQRLWTQRLVRSAVSFATIMASGKIQRERRTHGHGSRELLAESRRPGGRGDIVADEADTPHGEGQCSSPGEPPDTLGLEHCNGGHADAAPAILRSPSQKSRVLVRVNSRSIFLRSVPNLFKALRTASSGAPSRCFQYVSSRISRACSVPSSVPSSLTRTSIFLCRP